MSDQMEIPMPKQPANMPGKRLWDARRLLEDLRAGLEKVVPEWKEDLDLVAGLATGWDRAYCRLRSEANLETSSAVEQLRAQADKVRELEKKELDQQRRRGKQESPNV